MAAITFPDSTKTVDGYSIVTAVSTAGIPKAKRSEVIQEYRSIIDASLQALGSKKDPYIDAYIVMAHLQHESNMNPRAKNSLPARGVGQFIYTTQIGYGIIEPYNYADMIPKSVSLINDNFRAYRSVSSRDARMTYAVMAYYAGPIAPHKFQYRIDKTFNQTPYQYAVGIEKDYRAVGGPGFSIVLP